MARATIKATYSLRPEVIDQLERLAQRWGVSRSQAISRAISSAAELDDSADPVQALEALQRQANLDADVTQAWMEEIHRERSALGRSER